MSNFIRRSCLFFASLIAVTSFANAKVAQKNLSVDAKCKLILKVGKRLEANPNDQSLDQLRVSFKPFEQFVQFCSTLEDSRRQPAKKFAHPRSSSRNSTRSGSGDEYPKERIHDNQCSFDMQCDPGDTCINHQCAYKNSIANHCDDDSECSMGNHCREHACQ